MDKIFIVIYILFNWIFSQTEGQINQIKSYAKDNNLSQNQIEKIAKSQGYSDKQISQALKEDINAKTDSFSSGSISENNLNSNQNQTGKSIEREAIPEDVVIINDDLKILDETNEDLRKKTSTSKREIKYFGYDIFSGDPSLFQMASSGIVDPSYLVGSGDEIIAMLWGETQFRQVLKVDREGFVFIPEIGQVFVNGLNLTLLESKLFKVFSQSYASLNPINKNPTTFLDISLGNLRPLRIQVLGEVLQPGAYTVSPSATLFSSLYYFNGPTYLGSLRDVQLIRGNKKIKSIDFYDYLLTGKKQDDQKLQLDDVIFIPRRKKSVTIQGEINRVGIFELKSNESLIDLIKIAGGLKITAYLDRAQIDRVIPFDERDNTKMDRKFFDVNLKNVINSGKNIKLQDGDKIKIFSILESRRNIVEIAGSVTRPGTYELGDSLRVSELINKADGILGDAFLEKIDIIRTKDNYTKEILNYNLSEVLSGNKKHDILLKEMDRVRVYGTTEMIPQTYVSIIGHVKKPGFYPLVDNLTLYDLIFNAGGYVDNEFKKKTYLERAELIRQLGTSNQKEIIPFELHKLLEKEGLANLELSPNDKIRIFGIDEIEGGKQYVEVEGNVKNPGRYELFKQNMKIYDLLFRAGGFNDQIFKSKTYLERADLIRVEDDRITKKIIPFNLNEILNDLNSDQNFLLKSGDKIRIYSEEVFNTVKPVTINGIIRNPGMYEYKTGMSLQDLILESGGIKDEFYQYRIEISRIDPKNKNLNKFATTTLIDVNNIDGYSSSKSVLLEPFDLIHIRPNPYFRSQKQIEIIGEVLYPGKYTILTSNEKITDIIKRSGGLRDNAYLKGSKYFRNDERINLDFIEILKNPKSKLNFKIKSGDQIVVVSYPNTIKIIGQVNTPGTHKYIKGKRLRSYLAQAGGLTPKADIDNIWVEYPDGDSKRFNKLSLLSPKVFDGSIIIIGTKEEEEPFDRTEFAKEVTSILANLAQVITIMSLATK